MALKRFHESFFFIFRGILIYERCCIYILRDLKTSACHISVVEYMLMRTRIIRRSLISAQD